MKKIRNTTDEDIIQTASMELFEKFGIVYTDARNGTACGELILQPEHRNLYGIPYGGILFNLADNTAGMAFLSAGGNGVTVSGNVSYLRGANPATEKLVCQASVKKSGKKLFFVSAEVLDDSNYLLSEYMFIFTNLTTGD